MVFGGKEGEGGTGREGIRVVYRSAGRKKRTGNGCLGTRGFAQPGHSHQGGTQCPISRPEKASKPDRHDALCPKDCTIKDCTITMA